VRYWVVELCSLEGQSKKFRFGIECRSVLQLSIMKVSGSNWTNVLSSLLQKRITLIDWNVHLWNLETYV
jgi:hypothetical protein